MVKLAPFCIVDTDGVAVCSDRTFMFAMTVLCEEADRYCS